MKKFLFLIMMLFSVAGYAKEITLDFLNYLNEKYAEEIERFSANAHWLGNHEYYYYLKGKLDCIYELKLFVADKEQYYQ